MSAQLENNQSTWSKLPSLFLGAFQKAICFDALMNVGFGGRKAIAEQPFKILLATSIYMVRDVARELLPADYKWAAIGVGFGAGGVKDYLGKGELSTTALNNAAYEASKFLFNGTQFDDWFAGPIIESLESIYSIEKKTLDAVIKITFANAGAVTLGNNIYVACEGYKKDISSYLESYKAGENTCNPLDEYYLVDSSTQCSAIL